MTNNEFWNLELIVSLVIYLLNENQQKNEMNKKNY